MFYCDMRPLMFKKEKIDGRQIDRYRQIYVDERYMQIDDRQIDNGQVDKFLQKNRIRQLSDF